jgi:hypothetical protein
MSRSHVLALALVLSSGCAAATEVDVTSQPLCASSRGESCVEAAVHGAGVTLKILDGDQQYLSHISINAALRGDGEANGQATWIGVYHFDSGGSGASGYPWQIAIDRFVPIDESRAYVEGLVVNAPQGDSDEGMWVGFYVVDGPEGDALGTYVSNVGPNPDPVARFRARPIESGQLTVR